MGTIELRSNLHNMVDKIDNEQLLHAIYDFLKDRMSSEEGQKRKFTYRTRSLRTTTT